MPLMPLFYIRSARSFMNIETIIRLKRHPCLRPTGQLKSSVNSPLTFTQALTHLYIALTTLKRLPLTPTVFNSCHNLSVCTLSKAF